jgi:hypothetical protein
VGAPPAPGPGAVGAPGPASSTSATVQPAGWTSDLGDKAKYGLEGLGNALPWADPVTGALGDAAGGLGDTLGVMKTLTGVVIRTGAWVSDPHNWARVGMVAAGSVGVLIALGLIAKSGAAGDTAAGVTSVATKAASLAVNPVKGGAKGALSVVKAAS